MLLFIMKVTLVWGLLLLLFEFLYKKSSYFSANRIYLLGSLLAGIVIPLLPLSIPGISPARTNAVVVTMLQETIPISRQPGQAAIAQPATPAFRYGLLVFWLYGAGAAVMLLVSLKEVVLILRKAIYGQYRTIAGYKIFSTGKEHAPFSFMGWIFISHPDRYGQDEIGFILEHEDAHNRQKHWLDIIIIQLITIAFWFHPLVWRARHLLKLEHEYEADGIAAGENAYSYGHFLIQQTLLKGTPSIAHSFHYSPLKNRITMLTKNRKSNGGWKYAAAIPAFLCCSLLMAKSPDASDKINRLRINDTTRTGGNIIKWSETKYNYTDTTVKITDPETNETKFVVRKGFQDPVALELNGEKIKAIYVFDPKTHKKLREYPSRRQFSDFITARFNKSLQKRPPNLKCIHISNAVIDKDGMIQYYEIIYNSVVGYEPSLDDMALYEDLVDKIISQYGPVKVAAEDQHQNLFIDNLGLIVINPEAADQF